MAFPRTTCSACLFLVNQHCEAWPLVGSLGACHGLSLALSVLTEFPWRLEWFNLRENYYTTVIPSPASPGKNCSGAALQAGQKGLCLPEKAWAGCFKGHSPILFQERGMLSTVMKGKLAGRTREWQRFRGMMDIVACQSNLNAHLVGNVQATSA